MSLNFHNFPLLQMAFYSQSSNMSLKMQGAMGDRHESQHDDEWSQDEHEHASHQIREIHGVLMTVAWFALLQVGIWAHHFRSYRYAIFVHVACMLLITVLSIIAVVLMLASEGKSIIWEHFLHQTIGFFLVACLMPVAVLKGGIVKVLLNLHGVETPWIMTIKQGHRVFGWALVVAIKVPLFTGWADDEIGLAIFLLLIDIASYGLFWYLKLKKRKLEETLIGSNPNLQPSLHEARLASLSEYFSEHRGKSFIFANAVYRLQPILNSHPGGQLVIEEVTDREVDRYLYGMETIERYANRALDRHSHGADCLGLAGRPVARLAIREPYGQLSEVNLCDSALIECNQKESMFILYLRPTASPNSNGNIGYTSLNQLGRYRAVSLNGITRLYSNVEFLRYGNVRWMRTIMENNDHQVFTRYRSKKGEDKGLDARKEIELEENLLSKQEEKERGRDQNQSVPIFVKSYEDGVFTAGLPAKFNPTDNLLLSESRGFGLGLPAAIKEGNPKERLVLIAGGTGLHPYCDFIDLLYKELLVSEKHPSSEWLLEANPVLQNGLYSFYTPVLYVAIDSLSQIHPITLFQCEQLARSNLMECWFKVKMSETGSRGLEFVKTLPLSYRFELTVEKELAVDKTTRFVVCGTPHMSAAMRDRFVNFKVCSKQYRIL